MSQRRGEQEMTELGLTEREWQRAGQKGQWVTVPGPARPSRYIALASLRQLGAVLDGTAVRLAFTDGRTEYLASRDRLGGHDIGITAPDPDEPGEIAVAYFAVEVPAGTYAQRREARP